MSKSQLRSSTERQKRDFANGAGEQATNLYNSL